MAIKNPGPLPLSDERIAEVTKQLPKQPTPIGVPCTDRDFWDPVAAKNKSVITNAEKALKGEVFDITSDLYLDFSRTGNRTRWQDQAFKVVWELKTLVFAECCENKGRFMPKIIEILDMYCRAKAWVMPAHDVALNNYNGKVTEIDLISSRMGWDLAVILQLLGSKLDSKMKTKLKDNLYSRIIRPYQDMIHGKARRCWWITGTNNWNAVCHAGVLGTALAIVPSAKERAEFIVSAEYGSEYFLKGFTGDGYCSEGVGYWNYGFGHYAYLTEVIRHATNGAIDLFADRRIQRVAQFGRRMEIINDVYPAFADCGTNSKPSGPLEMYINYRFGLGKDTLDSIRSRALKSLSKDLIFAAMLMGTMSEAKPISTKELDGEYDYRSWFRYAGVLICRPDDSSADKFGVALKGGNNQEHHNHNDVGTYLVLVGKSPVLIDPGAEVYTARTFSKRRYESKVLNSYGHPVPLIDGQLQSTGLKAKGVVVSKDFTKEKDSVTFDIKSAYPVESLSKLEREFVYSRQGAGSFVVSDTMEATKPISFETALITYGKVKELSATELLVSYKGESVKVVIDAGKSSFDIAQTKIKEDVKVKSPLTRIAIVLDGKVKKAKVRVTVVPQ